MSEPEKPKRRFWQFHLSTAVILSLTSGGMMLANFPMRMRLEKYGTNVVVYERGWPLNIETGSDQGRGSLKHEYWLVKGLITNGALLIISSLLSTILFEYLIRRREGRKT